MVLSPSLVIICASSAIIFGSTLIAGLAIRNLIHEEKQKRIESRRRTFSRIVELAREKPDNESNPLGRRSVRVCSDPLNSEIISVFDNIHRLIYTLQKKSLSSPNIWVLINDQRFIVGEISLTPSYILSVHGRKQIANIELLDSYTGISRISLNRRHFPGDKAALDFEYRGDRFSWSITDRSLNNTSSSDNDLHGNKDSAKSLVEGAIGSDSNSDDLADIASCKALEQSFLDYELRYDPETLGDEAVIATCFAVIMTRWEPKLSLHCLLALKPSSPAKDATLKSV